MDPTMLHKIATALVRQTEDEVEDHVEKIRKKWKDELEKYQYMDDVSSKLRNGLFLKMVTLDGKNIVRGVVARFKRGSDGLVTSITLMNAGTGKYWKEKPSKYYVFNRIVVKKKDRDDDSVYESPAYKIISKLT